MNHISHNTSSFTELLTSAVANHSPTGSAHQNPGGGDQSNLFHKPGRQWTPSTLMDYFDSPLLEPSSLSRTHHSFGLERWVAAVDQRRRLCVGGGLGRLGPVTE